MADYPASMLSKCEVFYQLCHSSFSAHGCGTKQCPHLGLHTLFAMGTVGLVTFMVFLIQIKDSTTLNDWFPSKMKDKEAS